MTTQLGDFQTVNLIVISDIFQILVNCNIMITGNFINKAVFISTCKFEIKLKILESHSAELQTLQIILSVGLTGLLQIIFISLKQFVTKF